MKIREPTQINKLANAVGEAISVAQKSCPSSSSDELQRAQLHRVEPLLWKSGIESFRYPALAAGIRSQVLAEKLVALRKTLIAKGVPMLAIKGPALAVQAYGAVELRRFDDLDIMIPPTDLPRTLKVLSGMGYTPADDEQSETNAIGKHGSGACLWAPDRSHTVDINPPLHPRLWPERWTFCELWERRTHVTICGEPIDTPSVPDMLNLLALHGLKHGWSRLSWIADFTALLQKTNETTWTCCVEQATQHTQIRALELGIALSHATLGIAPPIHIAPLSANATNTAQSISASIARIKTTQVHISRLLLIQMLDSQLARIMASGRFLFVPSHGDAKCFRLPTTCRWLYPVLRPLRLAALGAKHVFTSGRQH